MRKHKFARGASALLLSVFILFPNIAESRARPPVQSFDGQPLETVHWVKNGEKSSLDTLRIDGERFVTVDQISQMTQIPLEWHRVSKNVCLNTRKGSLCFKWNQSKVYLNGKFVTKRHRLIFAENQVLVPLAFVNSNTFEKFSGYKFSWSERKKQLVQNLPITLVLPPIENLGDRYRLTLDSRPDVPYQLLQKDRGKIWIRFVNGRTTGSKILDGDKVVREVKINQKRRAADIIIKLGPLAKSSEVYFDKGSDQVVVDIFKPEDQTPTGVVMAPPVPKKTTSSQTKPTTPSVAGPRSPHGIRTIVIDAGHGGIDPGAIGTRGTQEKKINLKVAKALARELKKNSDYHVILTRDSDTFIALSERTKIANDAHADLFISIHCNSSLKSKTNGFEAYVLSPDATDDAAEAVARLENSVVALEKKKGVDSSKLEQLLASMAVYNYLNESSKVAAYVCKSVKRHAKVKVAHVKEANFHVLRGAEMPGVLLELEYLSNPYTESRLRSTRYLNKLVNGITQGINLYDQSIKREASVLSPQVEGTYSQSR